MANETEYSNAINVAAYIENEIMDRLKPRLVMVGLARHVMFQKGSDSIKLRKRGSVTASAGSEGTDPGNTELTQSSPATLQVSEAVAIIDRTDRNEFFSSMELEDIIVAGVDAVAEKVESDGLALFNGFSQSVGSTGVDLTPEVLREAFYYQTLNDVVGMSVGVLHPTQKSDVDADVIAGTGLGDVWAHPNMDISLLNGASPDMSGFAGTFLGQPIFLSTLVPKINTNADYSGGVIKPQQTLAFAEDGRGVMVEFDRDGRGRKTAVVINTYYDWGEAEDLAGTEVVSDV